MQKQAWPSAKLKNRYEVSVGPSYHAYCAALQV